MSGHAFHTRAAPWRERPRAMPRWWAMLYSYMHAVASWVFVEVYKKHEGATALRRVLRRVECAKNLLAFTRTYEQIVVYPEQKPA